MPVSDIQVDIDLDSTESFLDELDELDISNEGAVRQSGFRNRSDDGQWSASPPPLPPADHDRDQALWALLEAEPLRQDAFDQLEGLYRSRSRWDELVELYLHRIEHVDVDEQRAALLRQVADLYEQRLGDLEQAFDALLLSWSFDYADDDTYEALTRVARRTGRFDEALDAANHALAKPQTKDTKVTLWLQCAEWYDSELQQPSMALAYYEQVRAFHPHSADLLWSIALLQEKIGDVEAASQLAWQVNQLLDPAAEREFAAEVLKKLGDLSNQLGNREHAARFYEQSLQLDPDNLSATHRLEDVIGDGAQSARLIELLERRSLAAKDPQSVLEAKLALADAYSKRPRDLRKAAALYGELRAIAPGSQAALQGMEKVCARLERWPKVVDAIESQLELAPATDEQVRLLLRLAEIWQDQISRPAKAADCLERALEIDPGNEDSLVALAGLYRQMRQWDLLVHVLERTLECTADRAEQLRIYSELGQLYQDELADHGRAIDAFQQLLCIDADSVEALRALSKLYDQRGDSEAALDALEQLVTLVHGEERVELLWKMGCLHRDTRRDSLAALELYEMALELDDTHTDSLCAAREICANQGRWEDMARLLKQEAKTHKQSSVSAQLFVELGKLYDNTMGEHGRAIQAFEWANKRDPSNEKAAAWLVGDYMRTKRFEEALPLLKRLVSRASRRSADEQHGLTFMLGRCAMKLNRSREAIGAYEKAYALDPGHLQTVKGLASAYYNAERWEDALGIYQRLLQGFDRVELGHEEIEHVFYRLGVCREKQGDVRRAIAMYRKALEEAPQHRGAIEALIALYTKHRQWEHLIQCKRWLADSLTDVGERVAAIDEVAELWKAKRHNLVPAIEAWCEALRLQPTNVRILTKLLAAYQGTRQWDYAVSVIDRLSELEPRAAAKAKCSYTAGVIFRDELRHHEAALAKFDEALEHDVEHLKAFEAINKLLTEHRDWRGLERAYRKMIRRVIDAGGSADLKHHLFYSLGLIYRDRQQNYEAAADAFRTAAELKPDEKKDKILAELYTMLPGRTQEAIAGHHDLIRKQPCRVESHQALYSLYLNARAYDRAWCVANALCFLRKANAEQQRFVADYKPNGPIRPNGRMTRALWFNDLCHPTQDRYVSKLMELMTLPALSVKQASDKALQIDRLEEIDTADSTLTFARAFRFAMQILDTSIVPRLMVQPNAPGGMAHLPGSNPPAVLCGGTLLTGYQPQELMFVLGRFLTYYESGHFVKTLFASHRELRLLFLSALRLSDIGRHTEAGVDDWCEKLAPHIDSGLRASLREVSKRFVRAGGSTDIKKWMQGVELTAIRAGYLLCNDLSVACRMTQALPPASSIDVPPKQKLEELVRFSVSEEYFRLREALGITIGT